MSRVDICDVCGKRLLSQAIMCTTTDGLRMKVKDVESGVFDRWRQVDICPVCMARIIKEVQET